MLSEHLDCLLPFALSIQCEQVLRAAPCDPVLVLLNSLPLSLSSDFRCSWNATIAGLLKIQQVPQILVLACSSVFRSHTVCRCPWQEHADNAVHEAADALPKPLSCGSHTLILLQQTAMLL